MLIEDIDAGEIALPEIQRPFVWSRAKVRDLFDSMYNGFPASSVTDRGAAHCGIDKAGTIVTRGILLDVPRARGVDRLTGAHAIGADDLDAALELAGVTIQPGDVMLLRTGQVQVLRAGDKETYGHPSPGPAIPHRIFGPLTREEWHRLQLIHCAHHLSFAVPTPR